MRDSAWSFDGSIMTFAFPMLLFIVVAVALYVLYTKPSAVPGHRAAAAERPVSYTAIPGTPTATGVPGDQAPAPGTLAEGGSTTTADSRNATPGAAE